MAIEHENLQILAAPHSCSEWEKLLRKLRDYRTGQSSNKVCAKLKS